MSVISILALKAAPLLDTAHMNSPTAMLHFWIFI